MSDFLRDEKQNMFQIRDFTANTSINPLKTKRNLFSISIYYPNTSVVLVRIINLYGLTGN
jgi:hypothetical protein